MTETNDVLMIRGGIPLRGELPVYRAKNSALYLIFASLLTDELVVLEDVPRLSDVLVSEEILRHVGVETAWHDHELHLTAGTIRTCNAPYGLVSKMRASFVIMGALLGRCGEARVPMPGGCAFGPRPVDRHLSALREIGVVIDEDGGDFYARKTRAFGGTTRFEAPTVGGTQNVMLASVLGDGVVTIDNAALEPEVADLARMLNAMGADVTGAGTRTITVRGVPRLGGVRFRPIADRIEAGTYLLAVAASRGTVRLTDVEPQHLDAVLTSLQATGVRVSTTQDSISIDASGPLNATDIDAREYPGVPTDLQAPFSAFLATVDGVSNLRDHVYPDRFTHVDDLARTGARLSLDERRLEVRGGPLKGAAMHAADIRAGGALIVAALAAQGVSEIAGLKFVDRGYERFAERLADLGADVQRHSAPRLTATGTYGSVGVTGPLTN